MTFAHIADLQLGCNRFDGRLSRRREQDFYDAWQDMATRLAAREDITHVVIVGDIFDYPTPSTAARYAFENGLRTITESGLSAILVSGNHETPRAAETMHPLVLYRHWDHVVVVVDQPLSVDGFRVIPWKWGEPITASDLVRDHDEQVLVVHAACPVLEEYSRGGTRDFLPEMAEGYSYVALGDYHVETQVAPNAFYSGSLERTSFGEAEAETGCTIINVHDGGYTHVERLISESRPMVNHHIKDEYEPNLLRIQGYVEKDSKTMYRLILHGVEPAQIDPHLISAVQASGRFVKIVFQDRPAPPDLVDFGPKNLLDQWAEFVDNAEYGSEVSQIGIDILEEAIANG